MLLFLNINSIVFEHYSTNVFNTLSNTPPRPSQKHHWNKRCKELGGSDYNKLESKMMAETGEGNDNVLGNRKGYKYFGAARELPGVKVRVSFF